MKRVLTTALCLLLTVVHLWAGDSIVSQLSLRRFTTLDGLPQMQAETVWQDSRGYIWIGTLSGFVRYDGRSLTPFLKGKRENIVAFTETEEGVSALGFRRRWLVKGDKAEMHPIDPSQKWLTTQTEDSEQHWLLNNFNAADLPPQTLLLEDAQETNRQLAEISAKGINPGWHAKEFDLMTPDRKMFIDGDEIFVPTDQGLYLCRNKQWRRISVKDDFFTITKIDNTRYALAADGIYTLTADSLTCTMHFLFEAPDYGLFVRHDQHGGLFIADAHSLYRYDGHGVRKLASGFNMIKGLLVDRWGRLWMATYQGVYLFFHNEFTLHNLTDNTDIVRALCTDSHDHVVMGTLNGKLLVNGKEIQNSEEQFFNPSATRIGDVVYMTGRSDVAAIENNQLHWLQLPQDRYQFVAKAAGQLVVGTRQKLMAYHPENHQMSIITEEIRHPWCAAEDRQGTLWVGSTAGLYSITQWQQQHAEVRLRLKKVITTMSADSLGGVFFASDDSLFVISNGQITALNPQLPLLDTHEIRAVHVSPKGFLVVATIDGMLLCRIAEDYTLSQSRWYDHKNGFTLIEPQNAMMTETDDGTVWMAGTEQVISFTPERLMNFDENSTIIEEPRPWWMHPATWAAAVLMLGVLSWWMARRYERRRQRKTMEKLEREKRQKDLQISAIRLKAIPHFHTNVLAGIEYYLMNNSTDEAIDYLKVYSNFTNQTLADIDKPARSVAEEVGYIRNYLALEKLRFGEKLDYSITMAENVNTQTLMPTMALYTYCQNAVKHGIGNKTEGGKVDVNVTQRDGMLVVAVKDDGVGRAKAAHLNVNSTKQGLRILHEQIQLLNQINQQHIKETVTDLFDENGKPCGTCFELYIPLHYQFFNGHNPS